MNSTRPITSRFILLVGLIVVCAGATLPARAGAQRADVSIEGSLYEYATCNGPIENQSSGEVQEEECILARHMIQNHGPATVDVTVKTRTLWNSRGGSSPPVILQAWGYSTPGRCRGSTGVTCSFTLREGQSATVDVSYLGYVPGHFRSRAEVSHELRDPERGNNVVKLPGRVLCDVNGSAEAETLNSDQDRISICGWGGDDLIVASGHRARVFGGPGDDHLAGTVGDQLLQGGLGHDVVSYEAAADPISVWLKEGLMKGWGEDRVVFIERITGSRFADRLIGSATPEVLRGMRGADRIDGGRGRDHLVGGPGPDRFVSRDDQRDLVEGQTGADLVYADATDHVRSARRVSERPFRQSQP